MEYKKVVIRLIVHGEKLYITNVQPSSHSFQRSDKPFSDPNILKFDLEKALSYAEELQRSFPDRIVQVIDITGKTLNEENIHSIIKEEVENFVYEATSVKSDELKFVEPVNPTYENYESFSNDYDAKVVPATKVIVHWSPVFWKNEQGINKFEIDIEKVEGIYVLQMYDKQTDELKQETQKNLAELPWKFNVVEAELQLGGFLYVREVHFDFKANLCTVMF